MKRDGAQHHAAAGFVQTLDDAVVLRGELLAPDLRDRGFTCRRDDVHDGALRGADVDGRSFPVRDDSRGTEKMGS